MWTTSCNLGHCEMESSLKHGLITYSWKISSTDQEKMFFGTPHVIPGADVVWSCSYANRIVLKLNDDKNYEEIETNGITGSGDLTPGFKFSTHGSFEDANKDILNDSSKFYLG